MCTAACESADQGSFFTASEMLAKYSKMPVENIGSGKKNASGIFNFKPKNVHC